MPATASVILNPFFTYNGVDLTAQVKEISLPFSVDELEKTASGDATHLKIPGLENYSITVTFYRSFGAGSVDASLWAAKEAEKPPSGVASAFAFRRKNAAVAVDNPTYSATAFIQSYPITQGQVGTEDTFQVTFMAATTLARATA